MKINLPKEVGELSLTDPKDGVNPNQPTIRVKTGVGSVQNNLPTKEETR